MEHTLQEEECDSGLPTRREDRVRHAGNRGKHTIVTPTRVCYVDGFSPVTQTVDEFLGCVWHGCPCCHLNRRLVPKVHLDHSMEEVYDVTSFLGKFGEWLNKHAVESVTAPHELFEFK